MAVKKLRSRRCEIKPAYKRDGLFKKESELSTFCGANVAIVAFSPSNKVYACGNPSVESIVDKFVGENPPLKTDNPNPIITAHKSANINEINKKLNKLETSLERERKHGKALQALRIEPSTEKLGFLTLRSCGNPWSALTPLRARKSTSSDSGEGSSGSVCSTLNGISFYFDTSFV
uniref:MADS-box domain-containing protein n=1 Tax=Solanum lycopersicum TaxID=4081 RepID=A0A3Q7EF97_SOLLC